LGSDAHIAIYYYIWHISQMIDLPPPPHKPLEWIGRAHDELLALPVPIRRAIGYALRFAQAGVKPDHVKPLRGFNGAGVLEVMEDHDGDTYRAVYTVKLADVVYVLHCFQKKSKSGIGTPKPTMDLIRQRLRAAETLHQQRSTAP
jgi:phage-related protein